MGPPRSLAAYGFPARTDPALFVGVLLTGVATVLLGPLIPAMAPIWQVTSNEAAVLFVFQFVTNSIAALVSSLHLRRSIVGGLGAISIGFALLSTGRWTLATGAMAVIGLGVGLSVPALNLLFAQRDPERRGATLNTMNLIWGIGAVSGPLLFMAADAGLTPTRVLTLLAVTSGLTAAALAVWLPVPIPRAQHTGPPAGGETRALLPIAAMLFLYVGVEASIGGWLITIAENMAPSADVVALAIGSGFWATLLVGRAGAPFFLRHITEASLLWASLALAGLGTLFLLTAAGRVQMAGGALLAGLGLAAVFPLIVSLLVEMTAATGSRRTGWVFAVAGMGAAVLPWLSAQIGSGSGSVGGERFLVPTAGLLLLATLCGLRRMEFGQR